MYLPDNAQRQLKDNRRMSSPPPPRTPGQPAPAPVPPPPRLQLAGITKRIDADLTGVALYDPATLADAKALVA